MELDSVPTPSTTPNVKPTSPTKSSSTCDNLTFAIPALGIFLFAPLLSNMDIAFVVPTSGTIGLAALSPAKICMDQMLYLFSFVSRATTSIVSLAYNNGKEEGGDVDTAREAASTPLTFAIYSGISIFYFEFTPKLLHLLDVNPSLFPDAASYVYYRGGIAWAKLVQSVTLSISLTTGDALSLVKVIWLAAVVSVVGDTLFCVWPLRLGCAGAAAATSVATLVPSSLLMFCTLRKKGLLAKGRLIRNILLSLPPRKEINKLMEYVGGPLLAITLTHLLGFLAMQRTATRLGVTELASYQISINELVFFLLFSKPLSQLHQTKLLGRG